MIALLPLILSLIEKGPELYATLRKITEERGEATTEELAALDARAAALFSADHWQVKE